MPATAAVRKSRGPWQWPRYTNEATMTSLPNLLWTLHDLGGVIEDRKSGRAVSKLIDAAAKRGLPVHPKHPRMSISTLMREMERGRYAGCIARETDESGRRTYKITLLLSDDEMPPRPNPVTTSKVQPTVEPITAKQRPIAPVAVFVPKDDSTVESEPDVETVPGPESPQPEPFQPEPFQPELPDDPDQPDVDDVTVIPPLLTVKADDDAFILILEASQLLARAMIATNTRTPVTVGPTDAEIDEAAKRLSDTVAENQRLRRQLNEARETANARAKECEGLRRALLVAQGNLKAFQSNMGMAEGREKALARLRDTQKTMATPPTRRG